MGHEKHLVRIFARAKVMDMQALRRAVPERSRRSLFRDLATLGYFSSYTHTGRYYTLAEVPEFDEHGLWRYRAIGFSRFGTLKSTVARRVEDAGAGCTHAELEALLRLRVHNTLLKLVRSGEVGRETRGGSYLYVSIDQERAARQRAARRRPVAQARAARRSPLPPDEVVLLVLVEALHASEGLAAPAVVAGRLAAYEQAVTSAQVRRVYEHFGLEAEKKRRRHAEHPRGTARACPRASTALPPAGPRRRRCAGDCTR